MRATMSKTILAAALAMVACKPAAPPAWPANLVVDLQALSISRWRGDEPPRTLQAARTKSGVWRTEAPRRGEADPDAIDKLLFVLAKPAIISARPEGKSKADEAVSFEIALVKSDGTKRRLTVLRAALGQPVPVRLEGAGEFLISPVEFANKIPDPSEFLPPSLWPTEAGAGATLVVKGRVDYSLRGISAEDWVSVDGRKAAHDLDDVVGVIIGRQAVSHPEAAPLSAFGLDKPVAVATMCIKGDCREFKFGSTEREGKTTRYAVGPDQDPIEISDQSWRLLVDGPFATQPR